MKSFTKELRFCTERRYRFVDIAASVFINDAESGLHADFMDWLECVAPHEPVSSYRRELTI